ncbi:hypothetical protein niasHT_033586 [Heterodera trifolii]|uniref:DUF7083 domain-containing protein n=1 Tax=Heterodera trifolii TaxID=157864 RepID=A0ABD2I885_9BILA
MAEAAIRQLFDVFQQFLTAQQANVAAPVQPTQMPNLANFDCFGLGDHGESNIEGWLERFALALECSAPNLQDELKVKLLLTKLTETAYTEYSKHCLPKKPTEFDFSKTSEMLLSLFAKRKSVWIDRYECLRAEKQDEEDFRGFINRHKRLSRDFEFKKLNEEHSAHSPHVPCRPRMSMNIVEVNFAQQTTFLHNLFDNVRLIEVLRQAFKN